MEDSNQRQNIPVEEEKLQNNIDQKVENVQKSATDTTVASPQNSIMTPSEVIEATNANSSKKLLSNRQIAGVIVEILKSNGGSLPIENIAEEFAKKTQIPLIMLVRIKLKTFLERFREFDVAQGVVKLAQPKVNTDPVTAQRRVELVECLKKYITSSDPPILTLNYISKMFKDDKKIHIRDFIRQSVKVFLKAESATFTVIEGGNNRAAVTLVELARDKPDMVTEFMKRITGPVRDDSEDKGDGQDEKDTSGAPWDEQQRHVLDRLCTCDISRNFDIRNVGKKVLKIGVHDGNKFVEILMEKVLQKPARAHLFASLCSYLTKAFPSEFKANLLEAVWQNFKRVLETNKEAEDGQWYALFTFIKVLFKKNFLKATTVFKIVAHLVYAIEHPKPHHLAVLYPLFDRQPLLTEPNIFVDLSHTRGSATEFQQTLQRISVLEKLCSLKRERNNNSNNNTNVSATEPETTIEDAEQAENKADEEEQSQVIDEKSVPSTSVLDSVNNNFVPAPSFQATEYLFVNTLALFKEFVDALNGQLALAVDAHFNNDDTLGLLSVATSQRVYLLDITSADGTLAETLFGQLKAVFEDARVVKVVHDSRPLVSYLQLTKGIAINNVFDTQISYELLRQMQHDNQHTDQITPYSEPLGINGLFEKFSLGPNVNKTLISVLNRSENTFWNGRPLKKPVVEYLVYNGKNLLSAYFKLIQQLTLEFHTSVWFINHAYSKQMKK
jgi:hypothetical protein